MKNPFPRIRSWYTANRKYDGFVAFVVFGITTIAMLILNIMFDTTMLDWAICIIWLQTVLYNILLWQNDKNMAEKCEFYGELLRQSHKLYCEVIEWYNEEQRKYVAAHYRLVAANRRRKRAELALKKCRKTLRCVRTVKLEYEKKCSEYEDALLTAYTATYDYSVKASVTAEDIAHAKEARIRFNEYMEKHYTEMARNKFWREYKQDVFDCMYFPHSEFTPEHTDGFYHLLQNGGDDGAVVEIKENQPK